MDGILSLILGTLEASGLLCTPRPRASLSFQIPSLNYAMPFLSFIVQQDMHPSLPLESFNSPPSDNDLFSLISASRFCASDCDNVGRCPYFCPLLRFAICC